MRDRNKKSIITLLLVVFAMFALAGGVFAFSTGQLEFAGTVRVDASLNVGFIEHGTNFISITSLDPPAARRPRFDISADGTRVTITNVEFRIPGENVSAGFMVENTGTVPALIESRPNVRVYLDGVPVESPNFLVIQSDFAVNANYFILEPQGRKKLNFYTLFKVPEGTRERVINENIAFVIYIDYEWARGH